MEMKRFTKLAVSVLAVMTLACAAFMMTTASVFAADSPHVQGADGYSASGTINLLSVDGTAGDTIFAELVQADGKVLASRDVFTLKDNEATGVVTFNLDTYTPSTGYTVRAYADRAQSTLLYEGTLEPVYANLGGNVTKIIGTRVVSTSKSPVQDSARSFVPDETIYVNGINYKLQRDTKGNVVFAAGAQGELTFSYEPYSPADTITGSITYVDDEGTTVYTQSIPGIAYGSPEPEVVAVPAVVKASDNTMYRTVYFAGSVSASNPGQHDFIIHVKKIDASAASASNYYTATINLVDESGAMLATDSVYVTGSYVYTAPTTLYLTSNNQNTTYTITDSTKQVLNLNAQTDGITSGSKTYTISYTKQTSIPGTITGKFNLINGTKTINDAGRSLGSEDFTVTTTQQEALPKTDTIPVDGKDYVIAGGASRYAYEYGSGKTPVIDVYYVPKDYTAPAAYDVTVQYVNLANDEVITTKTYTSSPDQTEDLQIATDATISVDGADYVRLDGQEEPIYHNFYSNARTYTVYYRNVNDDLTAQTVITHIRVSYEGGTTTPIADTDTTATPAGALAGALNDGRTYNAINGDDGGLLTNENGTDTNTERIDENQTPLASGTDQDGQAGPIFGLSWPQAIGIGAALAAIVAAGVVLIIVFIRRRHKADAASAE